MKNETIFFREWPSRGRLHAHLAKSLCTHHLHRSSASDLVFVQICGKAKKTKNFVFTIYDWHKNLYLSYMFLWLVLKHF